MKRKIYLIFAFVLMINSVINGQISYPLDNINPIKTKYFMIIDTLKVEVLQNSRNNSFIFINNNPIDSTRISTNIPVWYKNHLFFNYDSKDFSKKIVYSQGKIDKYQSNFNVDNGFLQYYEYDFKNNTMYLIDPLSGNKKFFEKFDNLENISNYFFINDLTTCVENCFGEEADACDYTKYYLVSTTETKEVTQQIRQSLKEEDATLTSLFLNFISSDKQYLHLGVQYMSEKYGIKRETVSRIFNKDFQEIGKILDIKNPDVCGINIQKEIIQNYFLGSITDTRDSTQRTINGYDNKHVIIPYKFNPYLEISMYKAYNNNLLTNEDVKGLEKYELGILRNLIFAKYNYAFTSEFYQAYFNLYEFYGNEKVQKSRVKDVNSKLTDIDKANIRLIKEAETK